MAGSLHRQARFADCLDLLRVLSHREAAGVVVGGQAVNFWAEAFEEEEPQTS